MRVLLDTNVVLDILLKREPWSKDALAIFDAGAQGRVALSITACAVARKEIEAAISLTGSDFEDNLQIACAQSNSYDSIVTRDKNGFVASSIPVLTSAEFLQQLNKPKDATPNAGQP